MNLELPTTAGEVVRASHLVKYLHMINDVWLRIRIIYVGVVSCRALVSSPHVPGQRRFFLNLLDTGDRSDRADIGLIDQMISDFSTA